MKLLRALLVATIAATVLIASQASNAAGNETYADYSRITERSAGQFWAGGSVAGQWSWRTDSPDHYSISWDSAHPEARERFLRSADKSWLLLDGWSGNGTDYRQRVTSESQGNASCSSMHPLRSDSGRQHYVQWNIPTTAYCLEATGTITEASSGKVVNFRHRQLWSSPHPCSNAYMQGKTCIAQHEAWWDDNGHPMQMTLDRVNYLAKGVGMAFKVQQTYPNTWSADLRQAWTY